MIEKHIAKTHASTTTGLHGRVATFRIAWQQYYITTVSRPYFHFAKPKSVTKFLSTMSGLHSGSQPANQVQHTPTTRTRHGTRCKRKNIRLPLALTGTRLDEYTPTSFWPPTCPSATNHPINKTARHAPALIDTHLRAANTGQQAPALINTHLPAASAVYKHPPWSLRIY